MKSVHDFDASIIARFWAKVDKNGPVPPHRPELGQCWVWKASKSGDGYGSFGIRLKKNSWVSVGAHVVAYKMQKGLVPHGLHVCHACDNRTCCNGDHLFVGTRADNMQDCVKKKRLITPQSDGIRKLSYEDAVLIRKNYTGDLKRTADSLGVSESLIWRIVSGETYKTKPKLNVDDVLKIRARASAGETDKAIAKDYRTTGNHINQIVNRRRWRHTV